MKIADIQFYSFNPGRRNLQVVRVESDNGYYGWGEAGLCSRDLAVGGAVAHFRDFLIGQDPRRIGRIWQETYRSQYFEGGRVLTTAMAAIDIALHDLVARSLGVPVYQLLGGKQRDFVPCFVTTNSPEPGRPDRGGEGLRGRRLGVHPDPGMGPLGDRGSESLRTA